MSKLLVDIGNTRIKFVTCNASGKLDAVCIADTHDELIKVWQELTKPESVWVCSVASQQHNESIQQLCDQLWQIKPNFIQSTSQAFGVTNAYAEPGRLGNDRWLAMLAAYELANKAVLIADAGSALTIDAIDMHGKHLGGWFVPGIKLMSQLLVDAANFKVDLEQVPVDGATVFGVSSEQGLLKGAIRSAAALIDQAYNELVKIQPAAICYLTGGDAVQIQDTLQCPHIYDESLVLKGLALFATKE